MWGVVLFAGIIIGSGVITLYLYSRRDVQGRYYVRIDG